VKDFQEITVFYQMTWQRAYFLQNYVVLVGWISGNKRKTAVNYVLGWTNPTKMALDLEV
jgi:hypothetical protein